MTNDHHAALAAAPAFLAEPAAERWYVARTDYAAHSAMEEAASRLAERGFPVFYPTERKRRRTRNRCRTVVTLPLFPRFLFVRLDLADPLWPLVPRTRGVDCLLWPGREFPTPLPRGAVEELMRNQEVRDAKFEDVLRGAKPKEPAFEAGAAVRVTAPASAWFGISGTVLVSSADRVRALMSLFGRETEVQMPAEWLEMIA